MKIFNPKSFSFEWFPFLTKAILYRRISWSIHLRWLAVSGYFLATVIAKNVLDLEIPYDVIWILLASLAIINLIYYAVLKLVREFTFTGELVFLQIHILVDLIYLTVILHFSGGIENPVFFFNVFHVVISSIIFPGLIPLFVATFVVVLLSLVTFLEFNGIIPHYCIFQTGIYDNKMLIYLTLIVFTISVYVTTYICTTFMHIFRDIKRQIDAQNRKLTDMDKQKTQFFLFSSHELKSPIIAIKTSIDGFIQNFSEQVDVRGLNLLQRASLRSQQMLNIIKEMIDLSRNRIDLVTAEMENIAVLDVLRSVIEQERIHAESNHQRMIVNIPDDAICVRGEEEDFRKVFSNLLINAIRYTSEKGKIEVNAHHDGQNLWISIKDNGIGIPEKDIENVFNEFYRSENAKRLITFGTGLGLSLVRQIIRNYQGEITVQSEVDKGTTFTVRLPLNCTGGEK